MRLHPTNFAASPSVLREKCGTHSRLPGDIDLALLTELRTFANLVSIFTGAMNDRLNGHQTLPLSELSSLIPQRPIVYLAIANNLSGHTIATSVIDQLFQFYEVLYFTLRPMIASADPLTDLTLPEQRLMCHAWRMICDRGLIALYELCRLDIIPADDDTTTPIEILYEALLDARAGRGLLYQDTVDGTVPC